MAEVLDTVRAHVAQCRHAMSSTGNSGESIVFVLGNESADCDSIVSAIGLSLLLQGRLTTSSGPKIRFVPVINVPADEFVLRTDVSRLFAELGWKPEEVEKEALFRDSLQSAEDAPIVLVDHNRLASFQEAVEARVFAIVDHHVEEHRCAGATSERGTDESPVLASVRTLLGGDCRQIRPVGSCATLVSELAKNSCPVAVARLLMAAILLDTVNFDIKMEKATSADVAAAVDLATTLDWDSVRAEGLVFSCPQASALFDNVQSWRFDVSGLSTRDLLRQDYKQWTMGECVVGIASARRSVEEWLERDGVDSVVGSFEAFVSERGLNFLCVMNAFTDESGFRRQLLLFSTKEDLARKIRQHLESGETSADGKPVDLRLVQIPGVTAESRVHLYAFNQLNLGASRKQLQPILSALLDK